MLAADEPATRTLADRLAASHYAVRGGNLLAGGLAIKDLADRFGTPLFVYDAPVMRRCFTDLKAALAGFAGIYFSIKANPNPAIARIFVELGAGIEIASLGEYERARDAGAAARDILFAGPAKRDNELDRAIRDGIGEIHLESSRKKPASSGSPRLPARLLRFRCGSIRLPRRRAALCGWAASPRHSGSTKN